MTSSPLVSILIRSMDRPTLQRALDSVAAQDYPNVEVVVVAAGGSHRDLAERCGAFPLRLVRSARPLARAEAANVALEAARGDWFNFLDDDDELLPIHVSHLRAALDGESGRAPRALDQRGCNAARRASRLSRRTLQAVAATRHRIFSSALRDVLRFAPRRRRVFRSRASTFSKTWISSSSARSGHRSCSSTK